MPFLTNSTRCLLLATIVRTELTKRTKRLPINDSKAKICLVGKGIPTTVASYMVNNNMNLKFVSYQPPEVRVGASNAETITAILEVGLLII